MIHSLNVTSRRIPPIPPESNYQPTFILPSSFDTELVCRQCEFPAKSVATQSRLQQIFCSHCNVVVAGCEARKMYREQSDYFVNHVLRQFALSLLALLEFVDEAPNHPHNPLPDPGGHFRFVLKQSSAT